MGSPLSIAIHKLHCSVFWSFMSHYLYSISFTRGQEDPRHHGILTRSDRLDSVVFWVTKLDYISGDPTKLKDADNNRFL